MKIIHTEITAKYLETRAPNSILGRQPPIVNKTEETLQKTTTSAGAAQGRKVPNAANIQ
jgi:hypothetical protein